MVAVPLGAQEAYDDEDQQDSKPYSASPRAQTKAMAVVPDVQEDLVQDEDVGAPR